MDLKSKATLVPGIVNREAAIRQRSLIERGRERDGEKFAKKRKLNDGNTLNATLYLEALSTIVECT